MHFQIGFLLSLLAGALAVVTVAPRAVVTVDVTVGNTVTVWQTVTVWVTYTQWHTIQSTIVIPYSRTSSTPATTTRNPVSTTTRASSTTARASSTTSSTTSAQPTATDVGTIKLRPEYIVYSPYHDDFSCKNYNDVLADLQLIKSRGIYKIRMYGTDCNSINTVEPAAEKLGMQIMQGFWISPDGVDSIDDGVQELISWVKTKSTKKWDLFPLILVGNEAVYAEYATSDELVAKIKEVKSLLRAAGYNGPVSTAEPPNIYQEYPELCLKSGMDIVGLNSHPYFNPYGSADEAGEFTWTQIAAAQEACPNLDIIIVETGYPSRGIKNGGQEPSPENQKIAIQSMLEVYGTNLVILTTYDDYWKNPGPYGIEQAFGAIQLWDKV